MNSISLQRFSNYEILRQIGADLLGRFIERFADELSSGNVSLPDPTGRFYFKALAYLFKWNESLPAAMVEALQEIEQLALPEDREQLTAAFAQVAAEARSQPSVDGGSRPSTEERVGQQRQDLLRNTQLFATSHPETQALLVWLVQPAALSGAPAQLSQDQTIESRNETGTEKAENGKQKAEVQAGSTEQGAGSGGAAERESGAEKTESRKQK